MALVNDDDLSRRHSAYHRGSYIVTNIKTNSTPINSFHAHRQRPRDTTHTPFATYTDPTYPTPAYAFHEIIYRTQAQALVGMLMPILSVLAITPMA